VPGKDGGLELDVEAVAVERVIDGVAGEGGLAVPELHQFLDMGGQHVVAEDAADIGDQVLDVLGAEQLERLAVDLEDADAAGAFAHAIRVAGEMITQRGDAGAAPALEQRLHARIVLQPQRYRREVENAGFGVGSDRERTGHGGHGVGCGGDNR